MKNYLKKLLGKNNLVLLVAIFILATFIRFYNFPNRVLFWSEQARSLVVAASYIKDRPTLLGQEYFRVDSSGHKLFSGALFNYSLVPLLLIFNYEPVGITGYFAILNIFTGLVIYFVVKKIFSDHLALISTVIFLFSETMISHSLFIWNYNYLPLVGILIIYSLNRKKTFLTGLLSGIGISLQFLFSPVALGLLIYSLWKSKKKIWNLFIFVSGVVLGNLPMALFDLRHDFYHARTLFQYFLDTIAGKSDAGFSSYYLLPFWPVFAVAAAWILLRVFRYNRIVGAGLIAVYIFLNLSTDRVNLNMPIGMPVGMNVSDVDVASKAIANDVNGDFNVASVLDFDKRAFVLRYFVEYKYGKKPMGVEEYPNLKVLYVLAERGYDFEKSGVWEVNAGKPYKESNLTDMGQSYSIFKLEK